MLSTTLRLFDENYFKGIRVCWNSPGQCSGHPCIFKAKLVTFEQSERILTCPFGGTEKSGNERMRMNAKDVMIRDLTPLLNNQKLAVLSTHNAGQPYANLVSFAASLDLKQLLFATTRSTRKYANLTSDERAAMLIDNRSNEETDIHSAMAVTATGFVKEISDAERAEALPPYLEKHPYLKEFVNSPSCALLRLTVEVYYLVRRFQNVVEIHMPP